MDRSMATDGDPGEDSGRGHRHSASAGTVAAGLAVVVFGLGAAGPVSAQDQGAGGDGLEGGAVINLEETVVEGRIQKPEAFYILQHSSLNYRALEPKQSFLPELIESTDREEF